MPPYPDMPPNCTTTAISPLRDHLAGRSDAEAAPPQQTRAVRAPDEHRQAPPSIEEVLAEVDPFLHAIGARRWGDRVRHIVITNIGRTAQECVRVHELFRPGFEMKGEYLFGMFGQKRRRLVWPDEAYSDTRFFPPQSNPNIFEGRIIPALVTLVDLLLSAGMSIEGDFPGIFANMFDDDMRRILFSESDGYVTGGHRTPLNAVINNICNIEKMIHKPTPGKAYDRDSLAIQLDYMFAVFEVLMNAGASCHPCTHYGSCTLGSLCLACTSPWQCGPSSHSGRIFLSLLSASASLPPGRDKYFCALARAARMYSTWKFERLLQLAAGNLGDPLTYALFSAVERHENSPEEEVQLDFVRHLVQAGARLELVLDPGLGGCEYILSAAIKGGCGLKMVAYLVSLGTKILPHALAASVGISTCSVKVVEYLLSKGADVNERDRSGHTPLHAISGWHDGLRGVADPDCLAKVKCLLSAGADVHAMDYGSEAPLVSYLRHVAVPDTLVVQALLDPDTHPDWDYYLHKSLEMGRLSPEITRLLIQCGADVNKANHHGDTPLHILARESHHSTADLDILSPVVCRILLGSGADVNAKNSAGHTPLHHACAILYKRCLVPSIVDVLVAAGANVNAIDGGGNAPLHTTVSNRSLRVFDKDIATSAIVDILVAGGAKVDATDAKGRTPLHLAALHGEFPAVERLIVAGANVELLDPRGGGLLHYAACSPYAFPASFPGMHKIVNLDVNAQDHMGLSPLHWAARGSHNRANLRFMLKAGANVNTCDHQGRTPLHHAARLGTTRIAKQLISARANANVLDCQGNTPLTLAARTGSYQGVVQLLKAGASAPEAAIEFGEPLAIQGIWRNGLQYSSGPSRLICMAQFLKKDLNPPSRARRQLQITLLANLHDVYQKYPLRSLQEWSFKRDQSLAKLQRGYLQLPVHDMQVRMLGQGGFGDCYLGMFFGYPVVSKKLRFYEQDKYTKYFIHEASIWKKLDHPNIIPFLGSPSIGGLPHLMSPLMENGAADDFVKKNPNVNRVRMLVEITQGLEYMHTLDPPIIHGDLKANNVLVSGDGSACLSDFGLSRTHVETSSEVTPATTGGPPIAPITMPYRGNLRWGAPEVLLNEDSCRTPASDIFSLGRLKVELLTGDVPFPGLTDYVIIQRLDGNHYDRPTDNDAIACGLDDEMWALILECWDRDPLKRPSASQVVDRLRRMPEPASVNPSWEPCAKAGSTTGGDSSSRSSLASKATNSAAQSSMSVDWSGRIIPMKRKRCDSHPRSARKSRFTTRRGEGGVSPQREAHTDFVRVKEG